MYYGQEDVQQLEEQTKDLDANSDKRGVINKQLADYIRKTRAREQWERFDTIVIGPGAENFSRGWFNSWANLAAADRLAWFSGRDSKVGPSFTNQAGERTDWAQDLYQTCVQFVVPPALQQFSSDSNDGLLVPLLFEQMLPEYMGLRVILSEADEIAKAPASHFPAGFGPAGVNLSATASPSAFAGTSGESHVSNGWKWPDPIMLAAKSIIQVEGRIDAPFRTMLQNLPGPGFLNVPIGGGSFYQLPLWYMIKITHRGPRYLQMRGARSSS